MQSAANPVDAPPEQVAHSANARSPAVSRSVTRAPRVSTWFHVFPASCVAHSSGPNAQPLVPSRNLMPLTPCAPLGPVVAGAGPPCQVLPASLVKAIDVQMYGLLLLAQVPGVPAWPMTQALLVLTNVTETG